VPQLTDGIRQLEQLRVDGLITEYEFEQKRRQFLDRM
jgi:Short C-terminal domain